MLEERVRLSPIRAQLARSEGWPSALTGAFAVAIVLANLWGVRFQEAPLVLFLPVIGLTVLSIPVLLALRPLEYNLRLLCVYFVAFTLFMHLRGFADDTPVPVQMIYAIRLDQALFGGIVPTEWLQARFYDGTWGVGEILFTLIHASYFFVPYAVAVFFWRCHPQILQRYLLALMGTLALGLLLYFAVPTAPPWMAAQQGHLALTRILFDLLPVQTTIDPNPVAAMPSLHTALTCVVALALMTLSRAWKMIGIGYVLLMSIALVYLGEHYVVDVLCGLLIAWFAWWFVERRPRGPFTET